MTFLPSTPDNNYYYATRNQGSTGLLILNTDQSRTSVGEIETCLPVLTLKVDPMEPLFWSTENIYRTG